MHATNAEMDHIQASYYMYSYTKKYSRMTLIATAAYMYLLVLNLVYYTSY